MEKPIERIRASIEIGGLEATWVLSAHLYAVLVPLVLVLIANRHWAYLVVTVDHPILLFFAAVIFAAGSAFEVAQNAVDKWYLTPETASANGTSLCDMLFYWFITIGEALVAVALGGDEWWVILVAVGAIVSFPFLYLAQQAPFAPMSVVGLLVALLGYAAFGDPVIFLSLALAGVTMYFFGALLKTGAQFLHGVTTASAASGIWFFAWAVHNGDAGTPNSWTMVIGIAVATGLVLAALRPIVTRLPTSRRVARIRSS